MTASAQSPGPDEDATKSESGATTTPDGAEGEGDAGRLSTDDADRLAAQFRPSWESIDGGWSTAGDANGEDAPAAEKPEEPAAVAATGKPEPETPAAASVVVAPEPPPEASIIISPEASTPSEGSAAPETSNVGAPEPAGIPSVIIAPDSVPPPAPEPVRPVRVADSSAFDAMMTAPVLPARKSNRGMLYAAGGVAALIAVAVVAVAVSGSDDDDADNGAVASAPAEGTSAAEGQDGQEGQDVLGASAGGATTSADDPAAAEAPAEVRVLIRTEPADARLTLDGQLVDNPYDVSAAVGGSHTVVATAVGFEGFSESVSFGEDVEMMAAASSRMRNGRMSMGFTSTNPY
ncbi:MAG: hypothetical protein JRH11_03500 [Deltaproteobacteria bacterium]|nr:hypothetical protein [Deltaproteobacteria bacterium]